MLFSGGAAALALLSLLPAASAQTLKQACQYTPEWKPCNLAANSPYAQFAPYLDCAAMKVAQNWKGYVQGQSAETIMRLIRYKSTDPSAKSIIVNPGGPGGSGIDTVLKGGWYHSLLSGGKYHIVGFDPRGTGLNQPYSCISPSGGSGIEWSDDDTFTTSYNYFNSKAIKCAKDREDIGSIVDTMQTAYDVVAITDAVNSDGLIRYMGFSYGTLLGNVIARQWPDRVERMTLDGNIDPNSWYYGSGIQEFSDTDNAFLKFFQDCSRATADECKWHGATKQTYDQLVTKFNAWVGTQPFVKNRGRPDTHKLSLSRSLTIRNLMVGVLKQPPMYKDLARVLQLWYDTPTDVRNFCAGEDVTNYPMTKNCPPANRKRQSVDPNFNPADAQNAVISNNLVGIKCLDNQNRPKGLSGTNYKEWAEEAARVSIYANDVATIGIYNCAPWQPRAAYGWPSSQPWGGIKTKGGILFIQTAYDTVTPAVSGRNAKGYYTNSQIVFTDGQGHCSNAQRSDDLEAALKEYWNPTNQKFPQQNVYGVNKPNPFTDNPDPLPVETDKTDGEEPGAEEAQPGEQAGEDTTAANKIRRSLFKSIDDAMTPYSPRTSKYQYARYYKGEMQKRNDSDTTTIPEEVDFETCDLGNSTSTSTTSTTSTTSSSTTSTSTGTVSGTTTGTVSTSSSTTNPHTYTTPTRSGFTDPNGVSYTSQPTGTHTLSDNYTTGGSSKSTDSAWSAWNSPSTIKPKDPESTTWGPWSSKTKSWDIWTSQDGSVPVTKTVCGGKDGCKPQVVAIPTKTVYIDYVTDVCETGLTTKAITVTATCTKGCDARPTGIPQGYTTTAIWCSACAKPSTITVTVKVTETAKATEWTNITEGSATGKPVKPTATSTDPWSTWVSSAKVSTPAAASGTWSAWSGAATGVAASSKPVSGSDGWSAWASATSSGPVAKYTGAASANGVASGSLFAAVFAGLFML